MNQGGLSSIGMFHLFAHQPLTCDLLSACVRIFSVPFVVAQAI